MILFDDILPQLKSILERYCEHIAACDELIVNRDLNGRVRLIFSTEFEEKLHADAELNQRFQEFLTQVAADLQPHAWPVEQLVLFEPELAALTQTAASFLLEVECKDIVVRVIDRLATSASWDEIAQENLKPPRVVFFSIKGGVGRSSALAATAWHLAEQGKRVLVLDLDLESPGLSTAILPKEKQPAYGITDWLVEDLVDHGDAVLDDMIATSDLSRDGQIYVVPSHGAECGDYVAKLGRVWMPKINDLGEQEPWANRLKRLLEKLEDKLQPDVVLIDSRSGIDDIASSSITHLGAKLILLFAIEGRQSWSGYHIIFDYWQRRGLIENIRERLQVVAALVPEQNRVDYLKSMQDSSYNLFAATQYDAVPAGAALSQDYWHFESADINAPHYPWSVNWHSSFIGLNTLHGRLVEIDTLAVQAIFGELVQGVEQLLEAGEQP